MEPQKELNRALSQVSHILELSGNPVAVLENVEESTDIAVRPGAVWNIPEDAKAYLLDLLQGGGLQLHINYIELLYRALHDLSEAPRAAFGGVGRDLSGVAMQIELYPLLQKVLRKRTIRTAVYNRRNRLILKLLRRFQKPDWDEGLCRLKTVWGQVLPQDRAQIIRSEETLIQNGIHSRKRAMNEMNVQDPEAEFKLWLEEERSIAEMRRFGPRD
jgi:ubiquinone biosynthesis protein UbiJ